MALSFFDELLQVLDQKIPFAMGIISAVKGSSPQKRGAKALFLEDGRIIGTLGGGCLEAEVRKRALLALRDIRPSHFDLVLDHDFGWDDGLICGGKVSCIILPNAAAFPEIWRALAPREQSVTWAVTSDYLITLLEGGERELLYQETVAPREHLWIAGAGHIGRAVAPLAANLDFEVTVFDDRPALANSLLFPAPIKIQVDYWEKLLDQQLPSSPALGLILTRGHQHDALVLSKWIQQSFQFLGMIGSRRKRNIIFEHFVREGLATREQLASVSCPVGLPIEAISPGEIAVSIVAQLVQNRARRANAGTPAPRAALAELC
jgi:xanthine dehydrogenase accessory factor